MDSCKIQRPIRFSEKVLCERREKKYAKEKRDKFNSIYYNNNYNDSFSWNNYLKC